jgi:hypothetical protein
MRDNGIVSAHDIAAQAMRDKGLDPEINKKQCADFTRRFIVSLHDLRRAGRVEKIGQRKHVRWKLASELTEESQQT